EGREERVERPVVGERRQRGALADGLGLVADLGKHVGACDGDLIPCLLDACRRRAEGGTVAGRFVDPGPGCGVVESPPPAKGGEAGWGGRGGRGGEGGTWSAGRRYLGRTAQAARSGPTTRTARSAWHARLSAMVELSRRRSDLARRNRRSHGSRASQHDVEHR